MIRYAFLAIYMITKKHCRVIIKMIGVDSTRKDNSLLIDLFAVMGEYDSVIQITFRKYNDKICS